MPTPGNIDHWYELIVWLTIIVVGPGGGALVANAITARMRQRSRPAEVAASVEAHREVFDNAISDLEQRLTQRITETVAPLTDRQQEIADQAAEMARDIKRLGHKLDTNAERHDRLERDTYTAIARAERIISKHHPEDAS